MKKHCPQCDTDVRTADYYRHPRSADGLMYVCKACHKANVRDNYLRNHEHYREYERGRANLPHRIEAREAYAQTLSGREAHRRAHKKQTQIRPAQRAAR